MNNLDYLLPALRLELGDTNPATYRYTDDWLRVSLLTAVKALRSWWRDRYLVDDATQDVYRNPEKVFKYAEPPVIDTADEMPLILMAAVLVKDGSLEANSWLVSTWRDAEYYVSNADATRSKDASLQRTWDRLLMYLKPPTKRLAVGARETFNFGSDETR